MKKTKVKLGRGVSAEIGGDWHKFNCEIEAEVEEGEDIQEVKDEIWDDIDNILKEKVTQVMERDN